MGHCGGSRAVGDPALQGLQTLGHRPGRGGALGRFLGEELHDQGVQFRGHLSVERLRPRRSLHGQSGEHGHDVVALERHLPSTHLVQHNAEAEQIAAVVGGGAARLFGGHVRGGADDDALLCQLGAVGDGPGQAEVENLDADIGGQGPGLSRCGRQLEFPFQAVSLRGQKTA